MHAPRTEAAAGTRLWTRNFLLVLAAMHLYFLSFFGTFTALPLYLAGAADWEIGLVVGLQAAAAGVVRPYSGRLVDRYGRKPFQLWGALASGLALAGHALTADPYLLLPLRVLHGLAMSVFTTASLAMGADAAPPGRRGEAMGYYTMINNLAQLYGPWLGLSVATALSFTAFFLTAGLSAAAAAALGLLLREPPAAAPVDPPREPLVNRRALLPTGVFLTATIGYGAIQGFLALFAERAGLGNSGLFFIVFGGALVLVRVAAGVVSDRRGRLVVVVPGMVVAAGAMALLASSQAALFLPAAALFGAGFAMAHTGLLALTVDRAGEAQRGSALATFVLAWDVGTLLGTLGMGLVAAVAGFGGVFGLAAALPLLGVWTLLLARGPRPAGQRTGWSRS